MSRCTLCDLPTDPEPHTAPDVEGEFCCRGCLAVSRSLDDVEDVDELEQRRPESTPSSEFDGETTFLHVDGMHCSTCERFLEVTAGDHAGVESVEASYATDTIRVDYDPDQVSASELPDLLSVAGYTASDRADPEPTGGDIDVVRFLIGGGFFGMMAMLWYVLFLYPTYFGYDPLLNLDGLDGLYLFAHIWLFTSVVLFYTGYPILRGAYVSLKARQPNMDLLITLAATSAYTYSTIAMLVGRTDLYFDVTIAVVLVVVAGNHYEAIIKERATGLLSELTTATETTVRLESGDRVSTDDVEPHDRLLIRPGERVPFDGTVVEGRAAVDEALVTGESVPTTKREGDEVRGGTVVTDEPIVVEVGEDVSSTLETLVRLLWDIQSSRTGVQRIVDRLATVFVPLVIAIAAVVGIAFITTGASPTTAALVSLTVLIVSCPCALGLATPLAVAAGIRDAARRGIVVVSDAVFESASDVETVVFDKTGTLTDGEMRVIDVVAADDEVDRGESVDDARETDVSAEGEAIECAAERRVLERAATLERSSVHPIAKAIVRAVDEPDRRGVETARNTADPAASGDDGSTISDGGVDVDDPTVDDGIERDKGTERATATDADVLDRGVRGTIDGAETLVGHRSLFDGPEWTVPERVRDAAEEAERDGHVPVLVGQAGIVHGLVVVGDDVRDGWGEVLSELADGGRRIVVLTGDSPAAARRFEDHSAIDEVFAAVPPEAKAETVRRIAATERVAMVGDGSNDAPALAAADLGISMASGTDLAADAADAVLLEDRLAAVPELFAVTRGTNRRLTQNLGWAFVYNAIAIPLAITGLLNPLLAALAMATSSILVVTNSGRSTT